MKKIFLSLLLLSSLVFAGDFDDVDYNFIDTAFDGIKPVTNEQFEKTINQLTPAPVDNSFGGKLRTFFFGRKYGVEAQPKGQNKEVDLGGEKKAIEDLKNGVYYIKLVVSIIGADGDIIPLGNYKIKEEEKENQKYLAFYQGSKQYGFLKLREYEDINKKENEITYSRVEIVNDEIIRIVYSTIYDTKCAYAKVYSGN